MNETRPLARDPVTGTTELEAARRSDGAPSAEDLAARIRGTRARMTATLDQIEERLAPARIAEEVKHSVQETISDVRDQIHPRQMAKRAGNNMLDTIRENPLPALAAGLSIGYLVMKGVESDERSERSRFRRSGYEPYESVPWRRERADRPWEYDYRYEEDMYAAPTPAGAFESHVPEEDTGGSRRERMAERAGDMRHEMNERAGEMRHEMSERGREIQHQASERVHQVGERASDMARRSQRQARQMGREVSRGARRAERSLEQFVNDNPMVAGLITAGIGAIVGAAFPSTRKEDELMGHTRDEVIHQARDMAKERAEQVKDVARTVGDDARHHAEEVAENAKSEMRNAAKSDGSTGSREQRSTETVGVQSQKGNVEPQRTERPSGSIGGNRP